MSTVAVNTSKFDAMCRELGRMTGSSQASVVKYETAKVVEKAASLTIVAKTALIRKTVERLKVTKKQKKQELDARIGARGLARQGWWQFGRLLAFAVKVPAFVTRAKPSDGKEYPAAESFRVINTFGRYIIRIRTERPTLLVPFVGGERALRRAMNGRAAYFRRNLKHGVFNDVKTIARRYPGVRTA